MAREKVIIQRKYKRPGVKLKDSCVPVLRHINDGFVCAEAFMLEEGAVERNGQEVEYHILKIYFKKA